MLLLMCNIIKNVNSYRRETLWQVNSYRKEPYIYDFIIFSLIKKNRAHKNNPLSNLLVKINYFGHREPLASKVLLI